MALTCKLSNDILRTNSCGYSLPEVTDIYLANYSEVTGTSLDADEKVISGISLASGATFYHIEPAKNSTTFEDALVVEDSGAKYRTHTLTFSVTGVYDGDRHLDFDNLSLGRYFAVVKTAEGNYLAMGRTTGLEAETATLSGGGDSNGMQIVLSANIAESVIPLSSGAIDTVLGN